MSADNGIYILKTPIVEGETGIFEYRVRHAQAIDNITYERKDGNPEYVVQYFGDSEVFVNVEGARHKAWEMYNGVMKSCFPVVEYGICEIELPHSFEYYRKNVE